MEEPETTEQTIEVTTPPAPDSDPGFEKGHALAVRDVPWERGLEPVNLRETYNLAKVAFNSRLFSAFGCAEAVAMIILSGRSLG